MLGERLREKGGLGIVFHDWLSRDRDTAKAICENTAESYGPRPWHMGPCFEGHPITRLSINFAQWLAENPEITPQGGESFGDWYEQWIKWMSDLDASSPIGVVTHNRSIQALYSSIHGHFDPQTYNADGPDFLTVHRYKNGYIEPWDGSILQPGIYVVRHGPTAWGT